MWKLTVLGKSIPQNTSGQLFGWKHWTNLLYRSQTTRKYQKRSVLRGALGIIAPVVHQGGGGKYWTSVCVKARVVNWKQVDVVASRSFWLSWNVLIAHCTRRWGRTKWDCRRPPCVHAEIKWRCGSEGQFSENSAQKDRQKHVKTPRWRCWFGGS